MTERCYELAPYLRTIAQGCVERMSALGLKGKRRDDAALHYFIGARTGLEAAGMQREAAHVGVVCAMIVCVRGFAEVARMAEGR